MLVRHDDGSLELVTVFVAQGPGGARLIDATGETYTGLADFRAHNDLLASDDTVLSLRNITAVAGEGEIVTVTGHTPPTWPWWLAGAAALLATLLVVLTALRRRASAG